MTAVYEFRPDEIDYKRAAYQARQQSSSDADVKRIGNLGEIGFEQFCREYVPTEMWEWENEDSIRRCNPDSYSGHDFAKMLRVVISANGKSSYVSEST